jgi:phosphoribosylanthranilate isomerase
LHVIESRVINKVDCEKSEEIKSFLEVWGHGKPVLVAGGYKPENVRQAIEHDYKDYDVAVCLVVISC